MRTPRCRAFLVKRLLLRKHTPSPRASVRRDKKVKFLSVQLAQRGILSWFGVIRQSLGRMVVLLSFPSLSPPRRVAGTCVWYITQHFPVRQNKKRIRNTCPLFYSFQGVDVRSFTMMKIGERTSHFLPCSALGAK